MSPRPLTVDETILSLLHERGVLASADLASGLGIHERSVRRHLRRLIRAGYVFSPQHGRYRITAAGAAVMARHAKSHAPASSRNPRTLDPLEQAIVLAMREAARLKPPLTIGRVRSPSRDPMRLASKARR